MSNTSKKKARSTPKKSRSKKNTETMSNTDIIEEITYTMEDLKLTKKLTKKQEAIDDLFKPNNKGVSNWISREEIDKKDSLVYCVFQILGGLSAIVVTHYIFQQECIQVSTNIRGEIPLLVSEIIATVGLILTILFIRKNDEPSIAIGVALFITAGYWFTSSTSFANPAVTIARIFTDTFTGIAPISAVYFILGQSIGCFLGHKLFKIFD